MAQTNIKGSTSRTWEVKNTVICQLLSGHLEVSLLSHRHKTTKVLQDCAGQGLYKTPDDAPSEGQGASLVQAAPAGLTNMQSPWNTPALLQPPMAHPPDPASLAKPAGNDCMLKLAALFSHSFSCNNSCINS